VHGTGQEGQPASGGESSGTPALPGLSDQPGGPGRSDGSGTPASAGGPRPARLDMPGSAGANRSVPGAAAAGALIGEAKASLRARVLAARRAMPPDQRLAAGRLLRDTLLGMPEMQMAGAIAAYISVGSEPDTRALLFALWKRGSYVLLPVLQPDGDLDWASYEGPDSLAAGPRGLLEPTEPRRGVTAITSADLVIVPAVAADRSGNRLGRGGGSYDRALARVGAAIPTIALLYDGELLPAGEVPAGPLDQPVRAAALPAEGITRLR
jgi:5-formyltetrahydrofolate cyclo-ligase